MEQKKINIALGSVCLALIISNAMLFNALQSKANTDDVTRIDDGLIALETNYLNSNNFSGDSVKDYIMDNPDVVVKSLAKYRFEQEQLAKADEAKKVQSSMDALYNDANDPFIGNPNGKHVIVEFVDYNCGYCKRLTPVFKEFVSIDPEAKVIVKEYPIFTNQPTSAYSALVATAVFYYKPERYADVHHALMSNKLTREGIDKILSDRGINKDELQPYFDKAKQQIEKVRGLGAQLNVTGTPTVFIGSERTHGGLTAQQLKAKFTN
ncbi:membrane protein (plasmid) [Vibrio alfacsensis]|uniref:DsbA family protein n=1 Tax=Vibrio alfacsensis TaxID=1074311 RepID=UPI001BF068FF|nr:DsbA family protein [Vibrio alfacsensis]BBM67895.1 membrane protein [Vibrio alfacsensis]